MKSIYTTEVFDAWFGSLRDKQAARRIQARIVRLLVERVIVLPTELEVRLRANGLEKIVLELQADRQQVKNEEVAA